jgi:pilus assembly protein Flp/PilA
MKAAKSLVSRFIKGEEGVTLIEYGLLAALIAVACVTILTTLGTHLNTTFNTVNNKLP